MLEFNESLNLLPCFMGTVGVLSPNKLYNSLWIPVTCGLLCFTVPELGVGVWASASGEEDLGLMFKTSNISEDDILQQTSRNNAVTNSNNVLLMINYSNAVCK